MSEAQKLFKLAIDHVNEKAGNIETSLLNINRSSLLVQVATLRLLIKAGSVTMQDAVAMIEETQRDFPEFFNAKAVGEKGTWVISLLQNDVPPHGSIVDRLMFKAAADKKTK
jgi:hypothetical protein